MVAASKTFNLRYQFLKKKELILLMISLVILITSIWNHNQDSFYYILSCNDGDTCQVKLRENLILPLRLVGIDAPEWGKSGKQPYGEESKNHLNRRVKNQWVKIDIYGVDKYRRILGDIKVKGSSINLNLVKEGLAECYKGKSPKGYQRIQECKKLEEEAKKFRKGMWSSSTYVSPGEFRKQNKK